MTSDFNVLDSQAIDSGRHSNTQLLSPPLSEAPPLLTVSADVSSSENELCATCKMLKLDAKSFVVRSEDKGSKKSNRPGKASIKISFGQVDEIRKKSKCPLCRLVLTALGGDKVPEFKDGELVCVDLSWTANGRPKHTPEVWLLTPHASTQGGKYIQGLNPFPRITLLAHDSPAPSTTYFIRPICNDRIDFSLIRRWLSICETCHSNICPLSPAIKVMDQSHPADVVPSFRCIDVEQNCLVKVASGSRYAALSYVWGLRKFFVTLKSNVEGLEQVQSLAKPEYLDQIPQTIKDAMHVVEGIGIRYLWVDSLCIVQDDDSGDKMEAIKMMGLVYSAAHVVIIAAGSVDAFAEIAPNLRLSFESRSGAYLEKGPYDARCWTFQETHFATRSLVFQHGQVYFRCQAVGVGWHEDMFEGEADIKGIGTLRITDDWDDVGKYENIFRFYSGRQLTYDEDIYNAFAGVAPQLSFRLKSDLCHGIPAAYFDYFLLWNLYKENQVRRPNAPSWSWAGWTGGVASAIYDWYGHGVNLPRVRKAIKQRTWIIWYHRSSHESTECFLVWQNKKDTSASSQKRNFYGAKAPLRFEGLDCSQTEPTKRTISDKNTPTYSFDILSSHPGSGYLQFWTVSLTLRIDEPERPGKRKGLVDPQRRLGVFGRKGRELGVISVQNSWFEKITLPLEREFILICEGRDGYGDDDDEKMWRYKAMLIEWHGEYAERVAIVSIKKRHLKEALGNGLTWKEIILG